MGPPHPCLTTRGQGLKLGPRLSRPLEFPSRNLQHGPEGLCSPGSLFPCGLQVGMMTESAPRGLAVPPSQTYSMMGYLVRIWLGPMLRTSGLCYSPGLRFLLQEELSLVTGPGAGCEVEMAGTSLYGLFPIRGLGAGH